MTVYRYSPLTLAWPTDWNTLFEASRPLVVEIGFGNGDYLMALAQTNPDANILGIEITNRSLEKAESKLKQRHYTHVRIVHGWAETCLHHLFEPSSVREFHINYPDPWFKERHSGRRLIQRDTVDALTNRLEAGGKLYLATDILAYAEMAHGVLSETVGLENVYPQAWLNTPTDRLTTTKYEAKGWQEGRQGHYFAYRRTDAPAISIPVIRELPMPQVLLSTPLVLADVANAFTGRTSVELGDGIYFTAINCYMQYQAYSVLFELHIQEPTIDQNVALVFYPKEEANSYLLRYAVIGHPRPTLGLHRAVRWMADWIVGLHPEGRVLEHNLRE